MNRTPNKAWRVSTYGDINRTLDVSVVGRHEQDYAKLSKDEAQARRSAFQKMSRRFEHGELVTRRSWAALSGHGGG